MRSLTRSQPVSVAVGVAFACAVVLLLSVITIPIPLYLTESCPDCHPNVPRLPLIPLLAGVALAAFAGGAGRLDRFSLVRGLTIGLAGALYAGLFVAAAIPFTDPYFTTPYRTYGLAYLAAASFVGAAWLWRLVRTTRSGPVAAFFATPLLAVMVVAVAKALLTRDLQVAAVGLVAILAGVVVGESRASLAGLRGFVTAGRVALGLAVIAFAVRAVFGVQTLLRTGPGMAFAIASDDGDSYLPLASSLAMDPRAIGDVLGALFFPPGYTLFVAAILAATRENLAAVVVAQALLAAAAAVVLYVLARDLAGSATAVVATVLFALDLNLVQNESTLTAEALLMPLTLASVWALVRYQRLGRVRWLLISAAFLGGVFLTRNLVAFPLLGAAILWLWALERSRHARLARDVAILIAAVLIAGLPVAVASTIREGSPRLTTQLASISWDFYCCGDYTVSNQFLIDRGIRPFTDPAGSLARVAGDPLPVVGFLAGAVPQRLSTLLFFASSGSADPLVVVNSIFYPNAFGDLVRILRLVGLVVAIVAIARLRLWRTHVEIGLLFAFVLLYVAVFTLVFPPYHAFRYRIPFEPLRFIGEAAGLVLLGRLALRAWNEPQNRPLRGLKADSAS